ncbi:ATP-binding protein [Paraburkholderia sp. J10-1]|uniref:ATP-binding protein n=1 Tax=Paraburkholderia sp. J10-1 TaxID=2805430 RepID=UPI002AB7F293|nr:ATP-binding protein [Paraburkholderia sp. J10-1]
MTTHILGRLVGNTGDPTNLTMVLNSSFAGRRGEFVRVRHREQEDGPTTDVLARIVSISRSNVLYNSGLGQAVTELELLPGAHVTGEQVMGKLEAIGFRDPDTGQIKMPRRALDPGAPVEPVDFQFLSAFYEFQEHSSLHIGNLVGYERGSTAVPVYLEVNRLVTEHLAVLAMTGSGKSYTVGRVIERLVAINNGTVVVFDPHGEYGRALQGGQMRFNERPDELDDQRDRAALPAIRESFTRLREAGAGISIYSPQNASFRQKYAGANQELALQFDHFEMDDLSEILPGLTEPQQRVLDVAIRYWIAHEATTPRDINRLRYYLGDGIDEVRQWDELSQAEAAALNGRSAAVTSMKLSRVLQEAQSFYHSGLPGATDTYDMVGRPTDRRGRLVIVDLQGLSDTAKQVITALISSEILRAASSKTDRIRPCFIVYEEAHNFAPAGEPAVSHRIIKKIAGEGRKFGVGFAVVSQRPSKLDPDVTSQCNTLIAMRLRNPDDQRFIAKTSDMVSAADLEQLPGLSTGEALICGRSIPAPLLVRVGTKALIHGGESPEVLNVWGRFGG